LNHPRGVNPKESERSFKRESIAAVVGADAEVPSALVMLN